MSFLFFYFTYYNNNYADLKPCNHLFSSFLSYVICIDNLQHEDKQLVDFSYKMTFGDWRVKFKRPSKTLNLICYMWISTY